MLVGRVTLTRHVHVSGRPLLRQAVLRTSEHPASDQHIRFFDPRRVVCGAANEEPGPSSADSDLAKTRQQLNRILSSAQSITGSELRQLVFDKWGRSYDVRLQRRGKRMYLHVMWKHLEQQSFPLSEEEYDMQLQAVAEYLTMWGVADTVRAGIKAASKRGPGYTGGGSAKAISVPLDVDIDGARSGEWNSFLH